MIYDDDGREYTLAATPPVPVEAPFSGFFADPVNAGLSSLAEKVLPALNEPAQPESTVTASEGTQDKEQPNA